MTIVLIGPPAAGKSRIGRRLARLLDCAYTDTDKLVVAEHGSIADIFARSGEPAFRALERSAVERALAIGGVVSFGGGAVLDPATRADLASVQVVLLTVSADAVSDRIVDPKRPLTRDLESWKRLVAERMPIYESLADYRTDTSRRPVMSIAEEIARWHRGEDPAAETAGRVVPSGATETTRETTPDTTEEIR